MHKDDDFLTRRRPWAQRDDDSCPVSEDQRQWIEGRMLWLAEQFGREAARGDLAVPGPDFYPAGRWEGTPAQISELTRRIERVMGVDPGRIELEFFDGSQEKEAARRRLSSSSHHTSNPGRYRPGPDGRETIELDLTHAADPAPLAATIAHELAHARLIGEQRYAADQPNSEELTDLATVYLGMGIFRANAAVSFAPGVQGWSARPLGALTEQSLLGQGDFDYQTLGYLDEPQFGYALACLCGLRREPAPAWAVHLDPGVRVMLDRSLGYFRRKAGRG